MTEKITLCACGCGNPAPIATRTQSSCGHVKGQPIRFIRNHHGRKQNQFVHQNDGTTVVVLERRDGTTLDCVIDTTDFNLVNTYRWTALKGSRKTFYAASRIYDTRQVILMHRLLLPTENDVDHRDGNGLNNRRHNLRPATRTQNMQNKKRRADASSKYKGVRKQKGRFTARIQILGGKRLFLGMFDTEDEAARAYNEAATLHHGEFAKLNEVKSGVN